MTICLVVVAGDRERGIGERARLRVDVDRTLRDWANVADQVAVAGTSTVAEDFSLPN
jgi:hypothetical protein